MRSSCSGRDFLHATYDINITQIATLSFPRFARHTASKQKMDEVELPPLPASQASQRKYSLSLLRRKRSRSEYEPEPATSSDPALFSSDEPAPSAELYSAKRRKDKWRGTWWGERLRAEVAREKRLFKRSYDSGIWMGSEGT